LEAAEAAAATAAVVAEAVEAAATGREEAFSLRQASRHATVTVTFKLAAPLLFFLSFPEGICFWPIGDDLQSSRVPGAPGPEFGTWEALT
jgi:hypothetical protein